MSKKGKNITIKGVLYEDGTIDTKNEDFYKSNNKKNIKFDEKVGEAVGSEVTNQSVQSGIQAVVAQVQTQAANLGASGLIAVGSAGAFQVEHMHDNYVAAYETAAPIVIELVETGTISVETIAVVLPADSKFQGKELPVAQTVLGKPVGEHKKEIEAEANKSEEQKEIEQKIQEAVKPPSPNKGERDGSMTRYNEQDRSMT